MRPEISSPERARRDLKHLRALIDAYIALAVHEHIPDAMTPLLHMDRDYRLLAAILESWRPAREERWQEVARDRADRRGNR